MITDQNSKLNAKKVNATINDARVAGNVLKACVLNLISRTYNAFGTTSALFMMQGMVAATINHLKSGRSYKSAIKGDNVIVNKKSKILIIMFIENIIDFCSSDNSFVRTID